MVTGFVSENLSKIRERYMKLKMSVNGLSSISSSSFVSTFTNLHPLPQWWPLLCVSVKLLFRRRSLSALPSPFQYDRAVKFVVIATKLACDKFSKLRRKAVYLTFESIAKRNRIAGLLAITFCLVTFRQWYPFPFPDICDSFTLLHIRTTLAKLLSSHPIITGFLFIRRSLTLLANFFPLRGDSPLFAPNATLLHAALKDLCAFYGWRFLICFFCAPCICVAAMLYTINNFAHDSPQHAFEGFVDREIDDDLDDEDGQPIQFSIEDFLSRLSHNEDDEQEFQRGVETVIDDVETVVAERDDARSRVRTLTRELRFLAEWCASLDLVNRTLLGVGEPPDYNQAVREGAFDEWSAATVSGAAAFAPPRREAPPSDDSIEDIESHHDNDIETSTQSQITRSNPADNDYSAPYNRHSPQNQVMRPECEEALTLRIF
ncbi:hypothetical protein C0992_005996 [Termitomyces sp. T32_za158]|nr:hypothetical protein C0992_005996 [Termitomyces sp. T32_za158]